VVVPQIEVTTTTTVTTAAGALDINAEIVPHTNGANEAVDQQQYQQGVANGRMDAGTSPVVALSLHDIDLEKMHVDLYKGRYLTPQDFLDDISKIVQNTELRAFEDMDRMYKAQAMLIATQVSIQEFDPAFKLECERMAVRERQRREERRKNKEKEREREREKEKEEAATRRSTRIPGQTLEISITDPVKLERRLKRQRGGSAASSHEGEEDGQGEDEQERESKRSRKSTEEEDPSEVVGQATHVRTVHFATLTEVVEPLQSKQTLGDVSAPMMVDQENVKSMSFETELNPMIVDTVRSSGFDPTLLNPLPPTENVFGTSRTSRTGSPAINQPAPTTTMNAATSSSSMPAPSVYNSLVQPVSYLEFDISSILPLATSTSINPFLVPPQATDHTHGHGSSRTPSPRPYTSLCRTKTPEIIPITAPTSSASSALIIERPPTPLPEFHVDKTLLRELQQLLVKTTAPLNIEQLEQLRATCLGSVWRHRMDWERDEVVRELMEQVKEFVEEVTELDSDGDL